MNAPDVVPATFPPLPALLSAALVARDYLTATPVQLAVLVAEATDRDLLVSAQTGSGKTVAYGLALATTLLGDAERMGQAGPPAVLVIAPTRELAMQVHSELTWLYAKAGARVVACVGGMDARREARALDVGCHIVVGTPGRLKDHIERGQLDISELKAVVLDEADEMLDLGFREDLEFMLEAMPASRRTLLFSATIPRDIATLARSYQRNALRIDTLVKNQPHGDIEYRAIRIAPNEIEHGVVNVLRFYEDGASLVFCHTREAVRHLHAALVERGFGAVALSGELTQGERSHALQALRDGRAKVCVATDVAARGLDLPDLKLVIHADLPGSRETLLHRSGRTGRAGKRGTCVLLVPYTRRRKAEGLIFAAGIDAVWSGPPTAEEIRARDVERLLKDPVLTAEATEEDTVLAQALLQGRSAEEIATALARLFRARLPAPEDLYDSGPPQRERNSFGKTAPERDRAPRAPREYQEGGPRERAPYAGDDRPTGEMMMFRLNIGREKNADPKWLIPLICRVGHVTKREIGNIKIYDRETKFEIVKDSAAKFAAAIRKSDDRDVQIMPLAEGGNVSEGSTAKRSYERPVNKGKPAGGPRRFDKGAKFDKPKAPHERGDRPDFKPRADFGAISEARAPSGPRDPAGFKGKSDFKGTPDFKGNPGGQPGFKGKPGGKPDFKGKNDSRPGFKKDFKPRDRG